MGKLCPRGKAAAKAKFKVYPSAYANMYASAVCSGKVTPGGKKNKSQQRIEVSNYKLSISGSKNSVKGSGAMKLINATDGQAKELMLAKIGHTNAADAGLDIWTNFGVVISVKNYNLDVELFQKVLSDTPIGFLVIVCETLSPNLLKLYKNVSNGRSVMFITKKELYDDAENIFADKIRSKKFVARFLYFYDSEFPLTVTLEEFMAERQYQVQLPNEKL